MRNTEDIWQFVDDKRDVFEALSDRVFDTPELLYNEFQSAAAHEEALRAEGFATTTGIAGIPTAMMGEAGEGGPIIAILGEYDALPGLSQEPGVTEPRPQVSGGNGHGCGHNLLGAGALLAATALKDYLARNNLPGRVRYYGCPAEEGGAAKAFMVRAGAFEGVDAAITWHPSSVNEVARARALANTRIDFTFTGRASHASGAPHLGRSALDALELTSVGVNYMREHMPPGSRVHGAILETGGIAPNVVQARAKVRYAVRGTTREPMLDLVEWVKRIAQGAAMMTDTKVEWQLLSSFSDLVGNRPMEEAMQSQLERLGPADYDDEDRAFAAAIQQTLSPQDIATTYLKTGESPKEGETIHERVVPLDAAGIELIGSTDVGDVSWVVPTVQAHTATMAVGTPGHSWQLTAQGKSPLAKKGMVQAAKVMAATALAAMSDEGLLSAAKEDLAKRTAGRPYRSPIPDGVEPPLQMGRTH
ncbi:amidohydrolase [Acuticoccus sp.]|uniref:amidohydrolase n=1 Tax=Acuticoccus sp. TaxID=1904378 RepID=UPI003B52DD7D